MPNTEGIMKEHAADTVTAAAAHKVSAAGGVTALFGGLTANDIAAFGGLLIATIGLLIQWYYKRKADRRADELHHARLAELREDETAGQ